MTKLEFLKELYDSLQGIPKEDIEERISFYSEMIDDRIEDGLSEEEAISEIGTIAEIKSQIIADYPFSKLLKEKVKPKKKLSALSILLIILGSPIWLSLGIAIFAVILSVYVVIWSVIISLWAVFVSLLVSAFAFLIAGILFLIFGSKFTAGILIASALVITGFSIFFFFFCKYGTKGVVLLTKAMALGLKKLFF